MNTFFCSDHSRQVGEDIIGSASNNQTYILVECPPPWTTDPFNSIWVPQNLRILIEEVKRAKLPLKILLIANNYSHKIDRTTLLIYQHHELANGYRKQEFHLPNIEKAAPTIRKWLWRKNSEYEVESTVTRDILVCTHGSHDKCCSRYGNPFYYYATATVSDLNLDNVRIWRSSHFGGHRFAPTAIDLPEGRYYGNLDQDSFTSILTRTGDISCLRKVYRGWGILPSAMQILERELILRYGWDWFNYKVSGSITDQSLDKNTILAELILEKPDGSLYTYEGRLVKDDNKTVQVKGSCGAPQSSVYVKYAVAALWLASRKLVTCSS